MHWDIGVFEMVALTPGSLECQVEMTLWVLHELWDSFNQREWAFL